MGGITDSTLDEIKSRIDLGDLIASYGIALRHSGSRLVACCPFHNEKTPSFSIDTAKGLYHCFGCGESGDAIKFVMKQEGMAFGEAVRKLASLCGVKIDEAKEEDGAAARRRRLYALMAEVSQFYHACLAEMREAALAREYLEKRALDKAAQDAFAIGYAPEGAERMLAWAQRHGYTPQEMEAAGILKLASDESALRGGGAYHRFGGRLMFTIRDRSGRVVAFSGRQLVENKKTGKYVNSPDTEIFKKSNVLFALDRAAGNIAKSPHREAIICEGQIDCIRLHISGFPVAVAGQGTAFTEEHVRMLARVADSALLVYDDDAAGHKAAIRSAGLLLAAGISVRVVRLPDGDDPDSFLRTKGAEAFAKLCDAAESIVAFQLAVERGKERNPGSVDAVARITKALLATISLCPNAVLKAGMIGEAASRLAIPAAALNEELGKIRPSIRRQTPAAPPPAGQEHAEAGAPDAGGETTAPDEFAPAQGENAETAAQPPGAERDLMAFLMANEGDAALAGTIGEFVSPEILSHPFTAKFTDEWRESAARSEDIPGEFASSLANDERAWFDAALVDAQKPMACSLGKTQIAHDLVCALWQRHVERLLGAMDAVPKTREELLRSCALAQALPALRAKKWDALPGIISKLKQKGTN